MEQTPEQKTWLERNTARLKNLDSMSIGADGREVEQFLFNTFLQDHPELVTYEAGSGQAEEYNPKLQLFRTMLSNMAHDAVMMQFSDLQTTIARRNPDMPDFSDLSTYFVKPWDAWVADKIAAKEVPGDPIPPITQAKKRSDRLHDLATILVKDADGNDKREPSPLYKDYQAYVAKGFQQAHDTLRDAMPLSQRTVTSTPHPTETLTNDAIAAADEVLRTLKTVPLLKMADRTFLQPTSFNEERNAARAEIAEKMLEPMRALWNNLTPPIRRQTPEEEGERGLYHGLSYYRAIPELMDQQRRALHQFNDVLHQDNGGNHDRDTGKAVPLSELRGQYYLIRKNSWESTDQDSKPQATSEKVQAIIDRSTEVGTKWQTETLNDLLAQLPDSPLKDALTKIRDHVDAPNSEAMANVVDDLAKLLAAHGLEKPEPTPEQEKRVDLVLTALEYAKALADGATTKLPDDTEVPAYPMPVFVNRHGQTTDFTQLDIALVQRGNFHGLAQQQEIRQNAQQHDQAIAHLGKLLSEKIPSLGSDLETALSDLGNPKPVQALMDKVLGDTNLRAQVKAAIEEEFVRIKSLPPLEPIPEKKEGETEEEKARRVALEQVHVERGLEENFFQVLRSMQIATQNPDKIPLYLIAEARNERDLFNAFFMLKAIADPKDEERGKVEVSTLLEHRHDIETGEKTSVAAMQDPHFQAHHLEIYKHSPQLLTYDPEAEEGKRLRPRTVADVKRRYGIEPKEGDEDRIIQGRKVLMYAGSDSLRGSGVGIGPVSAYAQQRAVVALLDMEPPIEAELYMGAGGAIQRNSPTLAVHITRQGRNGREDRSEEIAASASAVHTNELGRLVGKARNTPDWTYLNPTAGNVGAGMLVNGKLREKVYASAKAGCESYEADFEDPRFAEYMRRGSATHFAKIINYSARAINRVGTKLDETAFPPKVDPEKMRAIEFSLSLAASGSCASLTRSIPAILRLKGSAHYNNQDHAELEGENLKEIALTFKRSPEVHDEFIRSMVGGFGMANRHTAWEFLGGNLSADGKQVTFGDQTHSIADLAKMYDDGVGTKNGKLDLADPRLPKGVTVEMLVAAHDEAEYRQGINGLITLMAEVNKPSIRQESDNRSPKEPPTDLRGKLVAAVKQATKGEETLTAAKIEKICADYQVDARELLMSQLPKELATEVNANYARINPAREDLVKIHRDAVAGKITLPKTKGSAIVLDTPEQKALYERIYYNFATVVESVERVPASLREPGLARAMNEMSKLDISVHAAMAA